MHDPIADMLTRIRNGQQSKHNVVVFNSSTIKEQIARVLKEEGYIQDYSIKSYDNNIKQITVELKYYHDKPVIDRILRISRPGLRVYKSHHDLHQVPGFGIEILSTSKGVMTHFAAKRQGIGGEVICEVA